MASPAKTSDVAAKWNPHGDGHMAEASKLQQVGKAAEDSSSSKSMLAGVGVPNQCLWGLESQITACGGWSPKSLHVLSCLVMGSSRIADLSEAVYVACGAMATHRISVWFEHVESCANVADGGSRAGVSDPVAENMGIQLTQLEWPKLDGNFVSVTKMKQEIVGSLIGKGVIRP